MLFSSPLNKILRLDLTLWQCLSMSWSLVVCVILCEIVSVSVVCVHLHVSGVCPIFPPRTSVQAV